MTDFERPTDLFTTVVDSIVTAVHPPLDASAFASVQTIQSTSTPAATASQDSIASHSSSPNSVLHELQRTVQFLLAEVAELRESVHQLRQFKSPD